MKCKINRHAAKVLKEMIANEGDTGKLLRVYVTHCMGMMLIMICALIHQQNMMKLSKRIRTSMSFLIRERNIWMGFGFNIFMSLVKS